MRLIEVEERKHLDPEDFIKRGAQMSDVKELIKEDCIIKEGGRIVCVYVKVPEIPQQIVETCKRLKYDTNVRTEGLKTTSKIFGYSPREQIRKNYCSSTAFARTQPDEHAIIANFGSKLAEYYQKYAPEIFNDHVKRAEEILKEWKISGSPFTSGIINKNNPLKYHYDRGNLDHVYSNMVAFKKDCLGGHLAMPEFDVALEISDRSISLFDGQDIIHGVTPFQLQSAEGYRFTLVYYTLKQMWNCDPIDKEIARIRKLRMQQEKTRWNISQGKIGEQEEHVLKTFVDSGMGHIVERKFPEMLEKKKDVQK